MVQYDAASSICQALGRGVTRSKELTLSWIRKAAENGFARACLDLAGLMYLDQPYAREVGHVMEAAGVATSTELVEGHDVPPDILTSVIHWVRKGCIDGKSNPPDYLDALRREALVGTKYCHNKGCEVVGLLKDFKVCPQCKTARYCGASCQTQDWTTGGHKEKCGKFGAIGSIKCST